MPTPALPDTERLRRKEAIEALVNEGFAPPGVKDGRPSASEALKKRDGVNYPRWISDERRRQARGDRHFLPCFIGLEGDGREEVTHTGEGEQVATAYDHAETRAKTLAGEINRLVTSSRYPLTNPDAIVVESYLSRRYDRDLMDYQTREGTPRTWLRETLRVATVPDARGRKYLFTAAQNDTEVHLPFWKNLRAYAQHIGAEIVVGPWTYLTSWWDETNPTSRSYADEIADYLCFGQMAIGLDFVFCGEMNTLATASQPIGDLLTYSRNRWAVFPHAKRQLRSVPSTDPAIQSHQVMTTGSVTQPKVIPRKAGIKSLFHQQIGACLVEFDEDGRVFCRQISAGDDGAFYDLDCLVANGEVTAGHRVRAVVCADIHLAKLDQTNALATFGFAPRRQERYRNSLMDVLRPEHVFLHDIFDNERRNHHHINDAAYNYELSVRGRDSVLGEIVEVGAFLERVNLPGRKVVVVESNHDLGLTRYVKEGRYRGDGANMRLGLQLEDAYLGHRQRVAEALDAGEKPESFSLLEHAVRLTEAEIDAVEWAYDGKSYLVDEVECGHHGFRGTNGSKAAIGGLARIGRKISCADKHTGTIEEGLCVAGAMQLQMGYNVGPSTWTVSHIVQYPDGARSLITLQAGRWNAERPRIAVPAAKTA